MQTENLHVLTILQFIISSFKFYLFYHLLLVLYVFLSVKCSRNDIISAYCKWFTKRYRNTLFVFVCMTCKRDNYNDLVPKFSVANKIGFPECPLELELYSLEETLVAPLLPFMTIHSLPVCGHTASGQKLIVGNVAHVPNDIASTVNSLPHTLDEMGTVPIQVKRKKSYITSVFQENVHPICVMKALAYLLKNHEMCEGAKCVVGI